MNDQKKIGVLFQYSNIFLQVLSNLWITPFIIQGLGNAQYGLISLSSSILVLLPLLDFGMTSTVTRYAAEYRATNDHEGLRQFLGVCQRFFYCISGAAAILCFFLYFTLDTVFPLLTPSELVDTKIMYIMLSAGSVMRFSRTIYICILSAYQRYAFNGILQTVSLVLKAVGSLLFVWNGYGAIAITALSLALDLASILPDRLYCWKVLSIKPDLKYWNWDLFKKACHYSIWVFLGTLSSLIGENLAPLIIGSACGAEMLAFFKIGTVFSGYFGSLSSVSSVFFPKIVNMVCQKSSRMELSHLMARVERLEFLIATFVCGGFLILGQQFITVWMGKGYDISWYVGVITAIFFPIFIMQSVGFQVMAAKNLLKFRVLMSVACNLVGSSLGYYLALKYGMFGLLGSRCLFAGLILCTINFIYFEKIVDLDIRLLFKRVFSRGWILWGVIIVSFLLLNQLSFIDGWSFLILAGFIFFILFFVVSWFFYFNTEEKSLIEIPLRKIFTPKQPNKQSEK